jgi:hypothetical protein
MSGINIFTMAMQVSMTIHPANNHQLQQMMKTWSACAMLYEVTEESVFGISVEVGISVARIKDIFY